MAASVHVRWYGDEFAKRKHREQHDNVLKAAVFLFRHIRDDFPGSGNIGTRSGGGNRQNPSQPGGIPHVQSGDLMRSITYKLQDDGKRVGAMVGSTLRPVPPAEHSYAYYLEIGQPNKVEFKRPYFRPAMTTYERELAGILATGRKPL